MNQTEFVEEICKICPYTKNEVKAFVDLFLDTLLEKVLVDNEKVVFNNFGKFEVKEKTSYELKSNLPNLPTSVVPESRTIKFIPSQKIRKF